MKEGRRSRGNNIVQGATVHACADLREENTEEDDENDGGHEVYMQEE